MNNVYGIFVLIIVSLFGVMVFDFAETGQLNYWALGGFTLGCLGLGTALTIQEIWGGDD